MSDAKWPDILNAPDVPPPGVPGGDMYQRGGRIDIEGTPGKVEEAEQESFPASDPPSYSPSGYVCCPPSCDKMAAS
jgi:hypothetical protein